MSASTYLLSTSGSASQLQTPPQVTHQEDRETSHVTRSASVASPSFCQFSKGKTAIESGTHTGSRLRISQSRRRSLDSASMLSVACRCSCRLVLLAAAAAAAWRRALVLCVCCVWRRLPTSKKYSICFYHYALAKRKAFSIITFAIPRNKISQLVAPHYLMSSPWIEDSHSHLARSRS